MTLPKFVVTRGPHAMPSLELRNPMMEEREFVRSAVTLGYTSTEHYELRNNAGAFLQVDQDDYVLVEFWKKDYEPFVQWLNDNYDHWVRYWENGEMK